MSEKHIHTEDMDLVGGAPCLDFVNTASGRSPAPVRDRLVRYADLLRWAERLGLVTAAQAVELAAESARQPAAADEVVARARELREAIYRLFTAEERAADPDLELLRSAYARASAERRLRWQDGAVHLEWPEEVHLERLLWPVAVSAVELLTSGDVGRVKECGGPGCNWLFYDRSRNRSRNWCDMSGCGNRAKARRYQARRRSA